MKTRYIQSAGEFLDIAGDDLLVDEIRHNLTYGIAEKISNDPNLFGKGQPWFIVLEDGGQIRGTAIRTPPLHRAILAHLSGDLVRLTDKLVRAVHTVDPIIPGVIGDKDVAEPFIQSWCKLFGAEVSDVSAQRLYQLTELIEQDFADGRLRLANQDDVENVISWAAAFHKEAVGEVFPRDQYQRYHERIQNEEIYLWDDAGPVSMAAKTRPTHHGISIGGVYTPPSLRNRGYASSCVAALSKRLLSKYDFCVLYTDLSNPTSNSIYKKIGFKEYSDSIMCTFSNE